MVKIFLKGKYDIQSFYLKDSFEVILSSEQGTKRLNFGDRVVYTKFYEEEITDRIKFPYYDLLGEKVLDKAQKKNYLVEHRIHIYLIRGLKFIKKIKDM